MLKLAVCLLVVIAGAFSDSADWIKDELPGAAALVPDQVIAAAADTAYSPVEDKPSAAASDAKPTDSTPTPAAPSDATTESATTTTQAPVKLFGCTAILWGDGAKFCWKRCSTASTSSFWSTWCFTTLDATDANSTKVACELDEKCQQDWPCKSSCGMFSPHWDRTKVEPQEVVEPSQAL